MEVCKQGFGSEAHFIGPETLLTIVIILCIFITIYSAKPLNMFFSLFHSLNFFWTENRKSKSQHQQSVFIAFSLPEAIIFLKWDHKYGGAKETIKISQE